MATNFSSGSTGSTPSINPYLTNEAGNAILVRCTTANIPSAAAGYAVGCILEATDSGATYINTGSVTSSSFVQFAGGGGSGGIAVKATNGTTPVSVFSNPNGFAGVITGAYLISTDTTAANITILNNQASVAVIAKGTAAGALVGAATVSNTTIATSGSVSIVSSSSSGQATVFITYTA